MSAHLQCGCGASKTPCGCCEGTEALTPVSVANRPGLDALAYRVGTHATFLETMLARLSTIGSDGPRPLLKLKTRDTDDPSIALLDAWAVVADVLTFYQERIANEGYLRTATERRSIIELARLVGYRLRPGVAASVYLALTIDNNEKVVIEPYEVRAQSVPGPGELPQSFENIEKVEARGRWNKLGPRLTQPQNPRTLTDVAVNGGIARLYLKGITTGLNPGDPLLVTFKVSSTPSGPIELPILFRATEVNADAKTDRTQVVVERWVAPATRPGPDTDTLNNLIAAFENPGAARTPLNALSAELQAERSDAELADFIERETLPSLERVVARRNISRALRERVRALSEDLGGAAAGLRERAEKAASGEKKGESKPPTAKATTTGGNGKSREDEVLRAIVNGLTLPASVPPRNTLKLNRKADKVFGAHSDLGIQALGAFRPALLDSLPVAFANAPVTTDAPPRVYAFRVKASPFGNNAPLRSQVTEIPPTQTPTGTQERKSKVEFSEWTAADVFAAEEFFEPTGGGGETETSLSNVIYLDGSFDKILKDSRVVVDTRAIDAARSEEIHTVETNTPIMIAKTAGPAASISRGVYGLTGKATRLELGVVSGRKDDAAWMRFLGNPPRDERTNIDDFQMIRRTIVYAQAELLPLTEEPIEDEICTTEENEGWIDLDGVYSELKTGRWVMVEGERVDVTDESGKQVTTVKGNELAMVAEVVHDFKSDLPGDTIHTSIKLATDLAYCYARDKVTIYANVVKATHGETRKEALGSGDGSKPLQQFALKQPPLTYVSAPTPSGVESTLKVFVNDVEWREAKSLFRMQPTDRRFVTTRNDAEATTTVFGDGKQGARLPTGTENIRAHYRQGIGKAGNVAEGKITMLAVRPLNVKEVINPQRASGGADPETRDQARKNAPLAVLALDRLVSTSDYANFARTFGGVGKAYSVRLSDGIRELTHVTIAGAGDVPIDEGSELMRNLRSALKQFGDLALPVSVAVRELLLLVMCAEVRLHPDHVWEKVAPKIRARLLETFSFEARELGQDVFLSEVISAMQSVPGVAYVDVNALGGIAERNVVGEVRTPNELIEAAQLIVTKGKPDQRVRVNLPELSNTSNGQIRPAQLAYLVPEIPDTLILKLHK